ncbi:MAG TPA: SLC13 family permease [Planctomycetaceae bacterium]|nr:SLC13 family permease [Planctomycetaceae bacterium]
MSSLQEIFAFLIVGAIFLTMQFRRVSTDVLFCGALGLFVLLGITPLELAWDGFANQAVIAIAGLLVVTNALRNTGALDFAGRWILGTARGEQSALNRLSSVVVPASAFLLNTAIVAMLVPVILSWCRRHQITASRLLLPISYLAILGGTCTLVGTSTNFVVNENLTKVYTAAGRLETTPEVDDVDANRPALEQENKRLAGVDSEWLVRHRDSLQPMGLFEISGVGIPCAVIGGLLLIFCFRRFLPDRTELLESLEERRREYLVEMTVTSSCNLIDKTVEEGGLRNLPGLFLIEIDRDGQVIAPVAPRDQIRENDRLVFTGVVSTIVDLEKIPGLIPAADINYEIAPQKADQRTLVEVVLSPSSPLVGNTIRQANFRQLYNAAVVAVHRNGQRLPSKIGDIVLAAGDTLLLQSSDDFVRNFRNRHDFYLISGVEDGRGRRDDKMVLACLITAGLVLWLLAQPMLKQFGWVASWHAPEVAIFCAAIGIIVTRCTTVADARRSIDLRMLLTIGAAIGIGTGFASCGAADRVASVISMLTLGSPVLTLVIVFGTTMLLTEMISNAAVAVMMFYIALSLAARMDVDPRPLIMAVTMAASLSFISPIGYQTNLMVMGPGGYRPRDYLRAGLPMSLVVGLVAIVAIYLQWTF